ncbi:MAG: histidine phosphatase family protein [Patescibacteria group bacterium]|nr:histidine phosphatase family protein [Patescibacteria group bacterium]
MKIYFATHATTTDNEADISSGWQDAKLSSLGLEQAKRLKTNLKNLSFTMICCSDLTRALDTVKLAFDDTYPIIIDQRLRELNYGDYNGKLKSQVEPLKLKYIAKPFPNGESYNDAINRTIEFYLELKQKYPDQNILIVGHRATQFALDILVENKTIKQCLTQPFQWQPYWEYNLI